MTVQYMNHGELQFFYSRVIEILDMDDATADELLVEIARIKESLHRHSYSSANFPVYKKDGEK
jgi:hypothetical protein